MPDFFVDSSAAGTNTGLTPANAATNVVSFFSLNAASIQFGDRFWVRKTHVMSLWPQNGLGKTGYIAQSNQPIWVIGWPNSGMPFYEDRPTVAISAGWDSDAYVFPDLPGFVVTVSRGVVAPSWNPQQGTYVTNFTLVTSNAIASLINVSDFYQTTHHNFLGNVNYLNCVQDTSGSDYGYVEELTVCISRGTGSPILGGIAGAKRITIAGSTVASYLFEGASRIGELVLNSNSVHWLARRGIEGQTTFTTISRVRGAGTFGRGKGVDTNLADRAVAPVYVDDWFGTGPVRLGFGQSLLRERSVSSAVAQHSGSLATIMSVASVGPSGANGGKQRYNMDPEGDAAMQVIVTSGVPFVARWHFYLRDCGSIGFARTARIFLQAAGASVRFCTQETTSSGLYAGSSGLWSGTSLGVGSAYMLQARFVPAESATTEVLAHIPQWSNLASGVAFLSPFFEIGSA